MISSSGSDEFIKSQGALGKTDTVEGLGLRGSKVGPKVYLGSPKGLWKGYIG